MKRFFILFISLLTVILLAATACHASSHAADNGELLSPQTIEALSRANATLSEKNGCSIHVTTEPEIEGDVADFAFGLFASYGLDDRAVLLVLTQSDYYLVRGAGLEDELPESEMKALLASHTEPEFAAGDPDAAVAKTVGALASVLERVRTTDLSSMAHSLLVLFVVLVMIVLVLVLVLVVNRIINSRRARMRRRRRRPTVR